MMKTNKRNWRLCCHDNLMTLPRIDRSSLSQLLQISMEKPRSIFPPMFLCVRRTGSSDLADHADPQTSFQSARENLISNQNQNIYRTYVLRRAIVAFVLQAMQLYGNASVHSAVRQSVSGVEAQPSRWVNIRVSLGVFFSCLLSSSSLDFFLFTRWDGILGFQREEKIAYTKRRNILDLSDSLFIPEQKVTRKSIAIDTAAI